MKITSLPRSGGILAILLTVFFMLTTLSIVAAQEKKRIIVIETMPVPVVLEYSAWFMKEMARLGYLNGKNSDFVIIKAKGDKDRAQRLLRGEIDKGKPDMVVTFATLASQAAHNVLKGSKIPIVFSVVSDPVGAGLIKEVGIPSGTNLTGLVYTLFRKTKVDMVMRLLSQKGLGRPIRLGIVHSSYPSAKGDIRHLMAIARERGDVQFVAHEIKYRKTQQGLEEMLADYKKGVDDLKDKIDFWWQVSGPLGEVRQSTELLLKSGPSLVYGNSLKSVEMGAMLSVVSDFKEGGREAAKLADAVLRGVDPAAIPVLPPENFIIAVNLTTALKLKIAIPSDTMNLAGKNIYR